MKLSKLNEGIRRGVSATFKMDLDNDMEDDLVHLTGIVKISERHTRWYNVKIYYSFMVNTNVVTRNINKDLAHLASYLKKDPVDSVRFINLAVEHFVDNYANITDIDLITYPESSSDFNRTLATQLAGWLGVRVIDAGFMKKTLGQTMKEVVTPQSREDMHQFKKTEWSGKKNASAALTAIWDYLYQKNRGQIWKILDPQRTSKEEGRYLLSQRKYFVPLIIKLTQINEIYQEVANDPERKRLDELIDKTAEYWSARETFKLERAIRKQIGKNKAGQSSRPTKVKKITGKDKREFLNYLNISPEMDSELSNYKNILVIDDNTDFGGTFSRINQIIGGVEDLNVHYYAPLLMKINDRS